jgi:hypothetical protein
MKKHGRPVIRMGMVLRWVAIVTGLLLLTVGVYHYRKSQQARDIANAGPAIKTPGWLKSEHIGAVLILSGGDSIVLDGQNKGVVAEQNGMQVIQSGGMIWYTGESESLLYNEIHTAKGKLWRCVLPDQTVVWLNGNSSIKYPLHFLSEARSVEMTGEAYFEVMHQNNYRFRVRTAGGIIEDLGTKFNIRSYGSDSASTTLVEGSVRVSWNSQQATLIPGQQSVVRIGEKEIRVVKNANVKQALAWKNGIFYFQNSTLTDVMKELGEWYQVNVVYKGKPGGQLFSGQIDKSLSLSDVLEGLQQPGVKFNLNGTLVTVTQE